MSKHGKDVYQFTKRFWCGSFQKISSCFCFKVEMECHDILFRNVFIMSTNYHALKMYYLCMSSNFLPIISIVKLNNNLSWFKTKFTLFPLLLTVCVQRFQSVCLRWTSYQYLSQSVSLAFYQTVWSSHHQ